MNKPHKHEKLIKQWAEGAEIEVYCKSAGRWYRSRPDWDESLEYRVKPIEKWNPKCTLIVSECGGNSSGSIFSRVPDGIPNYWKLTKFVEEFETDWDNQRYEVLKDFDNIYTFLSFACRPSLGTIRMSKGCADKLCSMFNSGEVEL